MPPAQRLLSDVWSDARPGEHGVVDVAGTRLTSLEPGQLPSASVLRVRELIASDNRLTNFSGIASLQSLEALDVSDNSLRSVDARTNADELAQCPKLTSLTCANNNISLVALGGDVPFAHLVSIDLSCNLLTEIPQLSGCTGLEHLMLHGNKIDNLEVMPDRVSPDALRTLTLHDNAIDDWYALRDMLFTENLTSLTIAGNGCVDAARHDGFILARFVAEQLAGLTELDGKPVDHHDDSSELFESLSLPRHELIVKLRSICPLSRSDAVGASTGALSATGTFVGQQSVDGLVGATDFNALAAKVQKVAATVHVLRAVDIDRRVRAVNRVKAFFRMVVVRARLARQYGRVPRTVIALRREQRARDTSALHSAKRAAGRIDAIEAAVRQVWVDLAHFRGFLHSRRQWAATKIQAAFRGSVARRRYSAVRREFHQFAERYIPNIIRMQSFARLVIAKRVARQRRREMRRQHLLEREVSDLKAEVAELKGLVRALLADKDTARMSAAVDDVHSAPTDSYTRAGHSSTSSARDGTERGSSSSLSPVLNTRGAPRSGVVGANAARHASAALSMASVGSPDEARRVAGSTSGPAARHAAAAAASSPLARESSRGPHRGTSSPPTMASSASPSPIEGLSPDQHTHTAPAVPQPAQTVDEPSRTTHDDGLRRAHRAAPKPPMPSSATPNTSTDAGVSHGDASAAALLHAQETPGHAYSWRRYARDDDASLSTVGVGAGVADASRDDVGARGSTLSTRRPPPAMPSTVHTDDEEASDVPAGLSSTVTPSTAAVLEAAASKPVGAAPTAPAVDEYADYDDDFDDEGDAQDQATAMGVVDPAAGHTATLTF